MSSKLDFSSLLYDLRCINVFREAELTKEQLLHLMNVMDVRPYNRDDVITRLNTDCEPALYLVLEGSVRLERAGMAPIVLPSGCNFGEELLKAADWLLDESTMVTAPYTVTAAVNNCTCAVLTMKACRTVFDIDGIEKASDANISMAINKNPKKDVVGQGKKAKEKEKKAPKKSKKDKAVVKGKSNQKPSKETGAGKSKKRGVFKKKRSKEKHDDDVDVDVVPSDDTTTKGNKSPNDNATTSDRGELTKADKPPVSVSSNVAIDPGRATQQTGAEHETQSSDPSIEAEQLNSPIATVEKRDAIKDLEEARTADNNSGHARKTEISTPPPDAPTIKAPENGFTQRQPMQQPVVQQEVDNDSKQESDQVSRWRWKGKAKRDENLETTDQTEVSEPTTVSQKLNSNPVITSQPSVSDTKVDESMDGKTTTPISREEANEPMVSKNLVAEPRNTAQRAFSDKQGEPQDDVSSRPTVLRQHKNQGEQEDVGTSSRPTALSQRNDPDPTFEQKDDDEKGSELTPSTDDQDNGETLAVTKPDKAASDSATAPAVESKGKVVQPTLSLVQEDGVDAEKVETASLQPQQSGGDKEMDSVKSDSVRWTGSKRGDIVRNKKLQAAWPLQKSTVSSSLLPHNSLSKQSALAKDELMHNSPESKKMTTNHGVEDDATKPRALKPIDLAARSMSPAENGEPVMIAYSSTDTMVPNSTLLGDGAERNPEGQSTEENATVESPGASPEDKLLSSRRESAMNRLPTPLQDSAPELSPLKTEAIDNVANETPCGSIQSIASAQTSSKSKMGDESTIKSPKIMKEEPSIELHCDSIQGTAPEDRLSKMEDAADAVEPRASSIQSIPHEHKVAEKKTDQHNDAKTKDQATTPEHGPSKTKETADTVVEPWASSKQSVAHEHKAAETITDEPEAKIWPASIETIAPEHTDTKRKENAATESESENSSSEDESSTIPSESSGKSLGDNKSSKDNLKARKVGQGSSSSSEAGESENESSSDSEESSSSSESLESSSSESESTSSIADEESSSSLSESDKTGTGYKGEIESQRKKENEESRTKPIQNRADNRKTKKKSASSHQKTSSISENPKPVSSKCSLDSEKSKKSSKTRNDLPPKVKKPKGGESKEQHKAASNKPTKEIREISSFLSARKKFENRVSSQNGSGKASRPPKNVFQRIVTLPKDYKSPVNPKSKAEVNNIRGALSKRFVFQNLPEKTTASLISAFEKKHVPAGKLIIKQGEVDDYFYIVSKGECQFEFDGVKSGEVKTGDSFGEDALVLLSARDASVRTKADTELFRVDQTTFRRVLQNESIKDEKNKREVLEKISFLQGSSPDTIRKLTSIMDPVEYKKGDTLTKASSFGDSFHIITEGKVECRDVTVGNRPQKDRILKTGKFFGKHALVEDPFLKADVVALTAGKAYKIDRKKKDKLLPTLTRDPLDARHFDAVKAFDRKHDTRLKREEMLKLSRIVRHETFAKGETIIKPDTEQEAMVYFLRKGKVHSLEGRRVMIVGSGTHFGEHVFLDAKQKKQTTGKTGPKRFTAEEECLCAIVRIQDYYEAFGDDFTHTETSILSEPAPIVENKTAPHCKANKARHAVPAPDQNALPTKKKARRKIPMENLDKRVCLGEGAFGQVWLCSDKTESKPTPYVLKIMSKAHLVLECEAEMCIREKNTMMEVSHPFIVDLVSTYNQDAFVFMLLEFVQGGELFSLMNSVAGRIQLKENQAKLYALTIADAISHMHAKKFVYRDLKPENILIDQWGYAKVIDFGFAKKLAGEKTFTICGTPGYLAPEAIASQGHDWAVDHWALGVLIYEMLSTSSPFYYDGIEELELFRSISEDKFPPLDNICSNANDLISSLLEKDPRNRLGSLANGDKDILQHAWFKGLSIAKLRARQIEAPWKPNVKDPFDTSNFDDWSDLEDKMLDEGEPLSKKDAALFDGF